ncbi:type II secretion system F family protein [Candidatus Chloroploca asiatica]|uniref:Type II secretion system protein GspF domain-containing protein n=1 Tax=Candidatus Chloroploca asiatica TaxID=1506545 RepID=A0A2H3KQ49_9CHLR|nr:hypothetical protein [Candidatus Chloroploca asiatica]PDW00460.1 hypothetical protein A9Q02_09730 [Candidatus Chloroploca asiatica]
MISLLVAITHPETAWLIHAVMPVTGLLTLLILATLVRPALIRLTVTVQTKRQRHRLATMPEHMRPDLALLWAPVVITPTQLVTTGLALAIMLSIGLVLFAPLSLALLLGLPLTAVLVWGMVLVAQQRYIHKLDQQLTAAVGRLSALLKAGTGLRPALERVTVDLGSGPLQSEWSYLISRQGMPLEGGGIATAQQVVIALADQTPSRRHANLLNHLGASVGQPQDVLARRCEAAYAALQASDRRRDEARTELAQMRYSGVAVGLAGVTMALYLAWTQWERVIVAYTTPLGMLVAPIVGLALILPVLGGFALAQVEDADY